MHRSIARSGWVGALRWDVGSFPMPGKWARSSCEGEPYVGFSPKFCVSQLKEILPSQSVDGAETRETAHLGSIYGQ